MTLIKEFEDYLALRAKLKTPAPWEVSIDEFRRSTMPNPEFIGTPEEIHSVEQRIISGPTGYLPIRIYRPNNKKDLPAMVYFHGGGWVIGNMDGFEPTVRSLANKSEIVVIQVQYQKAPEHSFPTPFDDCYSTYQWISKNAATLGIDRARIGVGGDSAGGNLAAAVAVKARDENVKVAFQVLVYPCTGNDLSLPSATTFAEGYGLTSATMRWFENQYAPSENLKTHPYAFPAYAKDFSNLAPAIVVTAEFDTLADDGRIYANKLRDAGVPVHFKEYEGAIHGFNALAGVAPSFVNEVQTSLAREINRYLDR